MFNFIFWGFLLFIFIILFGIILFLIEKYANKKIVLNNKITIIIFLLLITSSYFTKNYTYKEFPKLQDIVFGSEEDFCPPELQGVQTINENYIISGCS